MPPPRKANVLVVDDHPANLLALDAILTGLDINLVKANSGFEALRHLLSDDFAVILMDVKMPGMDGFETAELIRQRRRSQHTPIIFLTGVETAEAQAFKGYGLGAVDYLIKPIDPHVLRSKVSVFVALFAQAEKIKRQAEQLRRLEQLEHERQLAAAKAQWEADRLQQELRIARAIQQKLFPAAALPLPGLDVAGGSFPAEATGGDYFDYIPTPDGQLAVVVADVCGHGFGPALVMAQLRAYLRAFLLTRDDLGEVMRLLNRALADDSDRFATLLLTKLDAKGRTVTYSGAGHLPGYVFGPDGEVKGRLESEGLPLGVLAGAEYQAEAGYPLRPGDMVLLLTDGVAEAHGPDGQLFGIDRVLRQVKGHRGRTAREVFNGLYEAVRAFCGPHAPVDDLTAVVIKVAEEGAGSDPPG